MNRRQRGGAAIRRAAIALALALAVFAAPAGAATLAGTIVVEATIVIQKSVPRTTPITAQGQASVFDAAGGHTVYDTVRVKWSGGSATVKLVLPYLWSVESAAETMSVTLFVYSSTNGLPTSSMTSVIALPKNGSTTVVKLPAII